MNTSTSKDEELPKGFERFEGKLLFVLNPEKTGWWRYHNHYDSDGYCDNPERGY